jgi:hypothetical protein
MSSIAHNERIAREPGTPYNFGFAIYLFLSGGPFCLLA